MAGQQFVAKFSSDSFRSIAVAVRECANSLITKEPLGDRKVAVTKILRGEIGAELIEDVTKAGPSAASLHANVRLLTPCCAAASSRLKMEIR